MNRLIRLVVAALLQMTGVAVAQELDLDAVVMRLGAPSAPVLQALRERHFDVRSAGANGADEEWKVVYRDPKSLRKPRVTINTHDGLIRSLGFAWRGDALSTYETISYLASALPAKAECHLQRETLHRVASAQHVLTFRCGSSTTELRTHWPDDSVDLWLRTE